MLHLLISMMSPLCSMRWRWRGCSTEQAFTDLSSVVCSSSMLRGPNVDAPVV